MVRVTSLEFQKRFGRYRELAQREPVTVTSHGRDSLVVLSADEFARLQALDTRRAYHPSQLPDDLKAALDDAQPPSAAKRFDREVE